MAVLSSVTTILSATANGVNEFLDFPWALLLNGAMGGIAFYGLRIILLTVCLKLLLSPLDLFQRYKMRKNQLITIRIKPQLEKLEKAYGSNPKVLQQKQAELNRREGMSYLSSCLPMIVTLVVFIWLWQSLLTTANYKQFDNYVAIYNVYETAYQTELGDYYDTDTDGLRVAAKGESEEPPAVYGDEFTVAFAGEFSAAFDGTDVSEDAVQSAAESALVSAKETASPDSATAYYGLFTDTYADWFVEAFETNVREVTGADKTSMTADEVTAAVAFASPIALQRAKSIVEQYARTVSQNAVFDYYLGQGAFEGKGYEHDSFLWVRDIWSPDVPWSSSLKKTTTEFKSAIGAYATEPERSGLDGNRLEKMVNSYETVMARVIREADEGVNGFLIFPVLAVALNVLSQIITRKQQKKSGQDNAAGQNAGCMKAMLFVMPVIMGVFALMYCAAFTLYMVTNAAMSLLINLVTTQISKKMIPIDGEVKTKKVKKSKKSDANDRSDVERYGRPDPNAKGKNGKK